MRGSSFAQHLHELNDRLKTAGLTPADIVEMPASANADDILEMVNAGILDLTVADDFIARLWAQVLPNITIVPDVALTKGGDIAWAVRPENVEFLKSLNDFIDYASTNRNMRRRYAVAMKRYFKDMDLLPRPGASLRPIYAILLRSSSEEME